MRKMNPLFVLGALIAAFGLDSTLAQAPTATIDAAAMTTAAQRFIGSLTPEQQRKVLFSIAGEARTNWSNTPPHVHPRPGLAIGSLTDEQRLHLHDLLRASLSSQGYQKVVGVMRLDDVHRARTLGNLADDASAYDRAVAESFGSPNYAAAIFGDPRSDAEWAWLLQGHHLGASFTVAGERVGFTPLFLGAGPMEADRGAQIGWSAMSYELAAGVDLVRSLTPEQLAAAMSDEDVPGDVVNGVGKKRSLTRPEGLSAGRLDARQQALLRRLVEEYVGNANASAAAAQLAAVDAAGWDNLSFSWRGALGGRDQSYYYRVQGPRIVIEATHQPQHMHSIVRDPVNDYGEDWLGLTYLEQISAQDLFAAAQTRAEE